MSDGGNHCISLLLYKNTIIRESCKGKMKSERFKAIDMIRGVAMVMVILVHYNQSFDLKINFLRFFQMGCQMFFVASGFGVAVSFSKKCHNTSYQTASRLFYISRIKSIVPAWYLMMLVIYIANTFVIILKGHTLTFGYNRKPLAIVCNLLLINGFLPFCNNDVMPGGWYIGTTVLFYLITPVLYLCLDKNSSIRGKRFACLGLSLLSVGISILMSIILPQTFCLDNNSFGYYFILTQFPCFALGMLLFFEVKEQLLSQRTAKINGMAGVLVMVIAIVLFFTPFFDYSYVVTLVLVGLSTYSILKCMIYYEHMGAYQKVDNFLMQMGNKSFYVYLVHGFFVWDFIIVVKKILNLIDGGGYFGQQYSFLDIDANCNSSCILFRLYFAVYCEKADPCRI